MADAKRPHDGNYCADPDSQSKRCKPNPLTPEQEAAVRAWATYNERDIATVSLDMVKSSSAGVNAWAKADPFFRGMLKHMNHEDIDYILYTISAIMKGNDTGVCENIDRKWILDHVNKGHNAPAGVVQDYVEMFLLD